MAGEPSRHRWAFQAGQATGVDGFGVRERRRPVHENLTGHLKVTGNRGQRLTFAATLAPKIRQESLRCLVADRHLYGFPLHC
ncbi:UNVERIFIED_ORG: hypothetical protein J2X79_002000 [Arthrobacter globiformis]|nr:hypothetical protein [Arthrobacter globiformis]